MHLQGKNEPFDLPIKKKIDICTIMYTSGTTGDPKGVMISNESILSIISGVNHSLESMNDEVWFSSHLILFLGDNLGYQGKLTFHSLSNPWLYIFLLVICYCFAVRCEGRILVIPSSSTYI